MNYNYITNTATSMMAKSGGEGIMVYNFRGDLDIIGNEFRWYTTNWLTEIGYDSGTSGNVRFNDNIVAGRDTLCTCTVGILRLGASCTMEVYGNEWYNVDPSTISLGGYSSTSMHLDMQYNYFDNQRQSLSCFE